MASSLLLSTVLLATSPVAGDHDLSWISGNWCSLKGDALTEERWLPATTNRLLAVNRTVRNGSTRAFEFLQIDLAAEPPVYLAQPGGRAPTPFTLTEASGQRVKFENPAHDFPTAIVYERDGDTLTATISGPSDDGEAAYPTTFQRCEDP